MSSAGKRASSTADRLIRLLLVDDDDVDREKFRRLLRRSGLVTEVEEVASGREAIARLKERKFDCVVVDYRLGDTTGTDLVRSVKEACSTPVPVIMVTGLGDEQVAVNAMREGAYDYLSKNRLEPENIASAIE